MENRTSRHLALLGLVAATVLLSGCGLLNLGIQAASVKLKFGCIPEGALVDTPSGSLPLETLRAGDLVIGLSGEPVRILQKHEYVEDPATSEYLMVEFATGERVTLSNLHRIDGIRAADLHPGDAIAGRIVVRSTRHRGVERSYDLLTEDGGYRIDGLPVNSMIEEMAAATR